MANTHLELGEGQDVRGAFLEPQARELLASFQAGPGSVGACPCAGNSDIDTLAGQQYRAHHTTGG